MSRRSTFDTSDVDHKLVGTGPRNLQGKIGLEM